MQYYVQFQLCRVHVLNWRDCQIFTFVRHLFHVFFAWAKWLNKPENHKLKSWKSKKMSFWRWKKFNAQKLNDSTVKWRFFRLFSAVRFTRSNSRLTDLVTIVGNKWHLGALVKLFEEHIGQEWFEPWDNLNWLVNNL